MLSRGRRASGARAAGAQAQDRSRSVTRAAGRTRRSALDPHQRHRACPVRPEAQYADPRVTRPRGELVCSLRRDCCAASTSEARTLRGHGCAFLAPSPSVIEGLCDISEVDGHLCRGCAIAAPESLASCRCRCRHPTLRCAWGHARAWAGRAASCRARGRNPGTATRWANERSGAGQILAVEIVCPAWRVLCSAAWNRRPSVVVGNPARPTVRAVRRSSRVVVRSCSSARSIDACMSAATSASDGAGSTRSPSARIAAFCVSDKASPRA